MWNIACLSLEISIQLFFFPFLFSSYCCFVDPCVICVVSGRCNSYFFALFYVIFKLSNRCIDTIFNAGKFSSSFFSWHCWVCHCFLKDVKLYASSLVFLFSNPFVEVLPLSSLLLLLFESSSHQLMLMVFDLSLSDSKSPQVSRTLLSIVFDPSNTVIRMVSTRLLISRFSNTCTSPLVSAPNASITIGITITFMFHSFLSSLASSRYLSLFLLSFSFTQWSSGTAKFTIRQILFFFTITRSGRLAEITWSVCIYHTPCLWGVPVV